ncbi:MAG TPA: hypothetical protein VFP87_16030 [Chitinophagaceae bacterium]|nr:hypothetical protein [Chitinophagaceae bacterium]
MRIQIALLACIVAFLFSCQKEKDSVGGGGGGANSSRLTKMVLKSGSDSSVEEFTYNGVGKIIAFKWSGVDSGQPIDFRLSYIRNSSGIIQQQIMKSAELVAIGIDSIVTFVNYDAGNNRYKGAVSNIVFFGFSIRDSIVFQYDGTGRLVSEIDYEDAGAGMMPYTKTEYSYSGSNLAGEKYYDYNDVSGTFDLSATNIYEYDSKINPLQFVADAPVLNMNPFYSSNNITKTTYVDATDPTNNYVSTDTYTYDSSNRPASSVSVTGTNTTTTTFYYQ